MSDGEKMASIVVLDAREDPHAAPVTAAIAKALAVAGARSEKVSEGRPSHAPAAIAEDILHGADAAVVLDPASFDRAREAGVPFCVVVFPGFDLAWSGDLGEADAVVVAHEGLVDELVRRGAPRGRVHVAAPVAPEGFAPVEDRAAAREALELPADLPLVVVPALAFDEWGLKALLVQLSLVSREAGLLFDVGRDSELAEELRHLVPVHGLRGWMFAEERDCHRFWQVADVVVARARGYEVGRALAAGAPLVLLPPGRAGAYSADVLESAGVAEEADVVATLAVTLDRVLEEEALSASRRAVAGFRSEDGAARVAEVVREAWEGRDTGRKSLPRGLPHGLERLSTAPPGEEEPTPAPEAARDDDLEARIDRELEELKKRI